MKKITIVIECENDAFFEDPEAEAARILEEIARKIKTAGFPITVRDYNGNVVGTVEVQE